MRFFDTHFHYYDDLSIADYVARFPAEHRFELMAVGVGARETALAAKFAETVPDTVFCGGVHPGELENVEADCEGLEAFYHHPKFKAVGEIGLDYFFDPFDRAKQIKVMEHFLAKSLELQLPAILHCRDKNGSGTAYADMYARLRDFAGAGGRFVCHCFSGTPEWAEKFLALGGYLGVTGIVTFPKGGNVREVLPLIPADRLLIETDSPYLAPVPFRGQKNHPGLLPYIAAKVAETLGESVEEIAERTCRNGRAFFGLEEKTK